jgi:hypothetical protein
MRKLPILSGVGILSTAAWMVTLDAREQERASGRAAYPQDGLEFRMVHVRRHAGRFGHTFFATELEMVPYLVPGQPEPGSAAPGMFIGGSVLGGTDHTTAGHVVGPTGHPLAHVPVRVEQGEPSIPQPAASSAGESDDSGAATAQPDPTDSRMLARPPGAGGPGRPVAGWFGPGLPGPGRPASPGW